MTDTRPSKRLKPSQSNMHANPVAGKEEAEKQDLPSADATDLYPSSQRLVFASNEVKLDPTKHIIKSVEVYHLARLQDYIPDLKQHVHKYCRVPHPLTDVPELDLTPKFINDEDVIIMDIARRVGASDSVRGFVRAGRRKHIVWDPKEVRAAIVTCGGLCPGLNDVIAETVKCLYYDYGVDEIYGIRNGYRGFYDKQYEPWSENRLNPACVEEVRRKGGTFLGTSRGGFDLDKIVQSLILHGINQLYIIGGDGTHRAADAIYHECQRRKLKIAVATVPKTIDNDIGVIDRSFGFNTAVGEAEKAIHSAQVEAMCTPNGIGIVKLMGRECGMIAAHATITSREADLCLIPEVPFALHGERGVLQYIQRVLEHQKHAVIVVAEGAGLDLLQSLDLGTDASGNKKLPDIGKFLKDQIKNYFTDRNIEFSIKYHDPSYMIRSVPSNSADSAYCMILAQNAVHAAMAGFTGVCSALVNNRSVLLPVHLITSTSPINLNPSGRTWERVVCSTHQPTFPKAKL